MWTHAIGVIAFISAIAAEAILLSGCSRTWQGAKGDGGAAWEWSKGQVRDGAEWVKDKAQ